MASFQHREKCHSEFFMLQNEARFFVDKETQQFLFFSWISSYMTQRAQVAHVYKNIIVFRSKFLLYGCFRQHTTAHSAQFSVGANISVE